MENYNVIGDIAGNYLTLQALLAKMPKAELLSLGDPNDRGPRSKEVIEFLMTNGRTVNSNHAHMMVEAWEQSAYPNTKPEYYEPGLWPTYNGGETTMMSYQWHGSTDGLHNYIPKEHIDFLKNCPMYIKTDKFLFTHAPLFSQYTLEQAAQLGTGFYKNYDWLSRGNLLWNRYVPEEPHKDLNGIVNIFGHNSSDMVKVYTPQYPQGIKVTPEDFKNFWAIHSDKVYGICIDTSSAKILTGLHVPSMTIYQQEYID